MLDVTRALAAPFELHAMLAAVSDAGRRILKADRSSVWLYDAATDELVLEVASDLGAVRIPAGSGLAGQCARASQVVNVPDCYADPRFNAELDRRSGYRTRCLLALPLIDHHGTLIGVLQLLNKHDGAFDGADEDLGRALAAQCAMALSRVRMTEAMVAGELLRQEVLLASSLQRSTLPGELPTVPGYELDADFRPATVTGGDAFDLAWLGDELLVVLADATGHGVPAALSVTQMHAMLRVALEVAPDLPAAYRVVNDRLSATLPDGRFVTAFIGLLDPASHRLRYISGGQGPLLHWVAADQSCRVLRPNSFPMGAMPLPAARATQELTMAPGDWFVLLSDGYYEYESPAGELLGSDAIQSVIAGHATTDAQTMAAALEAAVKRHARGAPQPDDMTRVLVHRRPT